jgi:hypothetical protein
MAERVRSLPSVMLKQVARTLVVICIAVVCAWKPELLFISISLVFGAMASSRAIRSPYGIQQERVRVWAIATSERFRSFKGRISLVVSLLVLSSSLVWAALFLVETVSERSWVAFPAAVMICVTIYYVAMLVLITRYAFAWKTNK